MNEAAVARSYSAAKIFRRVKTAGFTLRKGYEDSGAELVPVV
jgi:hypothetical protein